MARRSNPPFPGIWPFLSGAPEPVVAVSTHLDDAVLSVGATLAALGRTGVSTTVLTVLANDPRAPGPSRAWDAASGFTTAAEAARIRRDEDRRACEILGVAPVWLPFGDAEHGRGAPVEQVRDAVRTELAGAGTVLVPGLPLVHPDHAEVARLSLQSAPAGSRRVLYLEQPYALPHMLSRAAGSAGRSRLRDVHGVARHVLTGAGRLACDPLPVAIADLVPGPVVWQSGAADPRLWLAKQRAVAAYRSQGRPLGSLLRVRITAYEAGARGETLAVWRRTDRHGRR